MSYMLDQIIYRYLVRLPELFQPSPYTSNKKFILYKRMKIRDNLLSPCDADQAYASIVKEAPAVLSHLFSVGLVAAAIVDSAAFIINELPQKEELISAIEGFTSVHACQHLHIKAKLSLISTFNARGHMKTTLLKDKDKHP